MSKFFVGLSVFILTIGITWGQEKTFIFQDQFSNPLVATAICNAEDSSILITNESGRIETNLSWNQLSVCSSSTYQITIDTVVIKNEVHYMYCTLDYESMESITISSPNSLKPKNESIQISSTDYSFNSIQSSSDVLEGTGELYVQRTQVGGGSPVISGFEANRILLVRDGIRMNNAIFRGGHLQNVNLVDPQMFDIQLRKVPGGSFYGSDALGGVLEFNTPELELVSDTLSKQKSKLGFDYSSVNNAYKSIIGIKSIEPKIGVYFSGSFLRSSNMMSGRKVNNNNIWLDSNVAVRENNQDIMINNEDPYRQLNTGLSQVNATVKVKLKQNKNLFHTLSFQVSNVSRVNRYDRLSLISNDTLQYATWAYGPQISMLGYYRCDYNKKSRFVDGIHIIASYQHYKESRHTRLFNDPLLTNREERLNIYSLNVNASKSLSPRTTISYGVESSLNFVNSSANQYNVDLNEVLNNSMVSTRYPANSHMVYSGVYIRMNSNINEVSDLVMGVRFNNTILSARINYENSQFFPVDKIKQANTNVTGELSYHSNFLKGLYSTSSITTGFKAPNVDDVGKVFDSNPGNVTIPNADLKSEYILNFKESIESSINGDLRLGVSGYYSLLYNGFQIQNSAFNGSDSILYDGLLSQVQTNENFVMGRVYGVEGRIKFFIGKYLIGNGVVSFQKGKDVSNKTPLGHIPPTYGSLSLLYSKEKYGFGINYLFNFSKSASDYHPSGVDKLIFATPNGIPKWSIINVSAMCNIKKYWKLSVGVDNILNLHYRTFASGVNSPGRSLRISFQRLF